MKIGFLGSGNMAQAMMKGWINSGINPNNIYVHSPNNGLKVSLKMGINYSSSEQELIDFVDVIVLAFLPQHFETFTKRVNIENKIVISVIGSVTLGDLESKLPNNHVVRTLPNVNVAIKQGITAMVFPDVFEPKDEIANLFNKLGMIIETSETNLLEISALAGSGPAFVARYLEFLQSTTTMTLGSELSQDIVNQLILGTIANIDNQNISTEEFVRQVASPGGSTERGLIVIDNSDMKNIVNKSIQDTINFHK